MFLRLKFDIIVQDWPNRTIWIENKLSLEQIYRIISAIRELAIIYHPLMVNKVRILI